jgi:hypothetical protein
MMLTSRVTSSSGMLSVFSDSTVTHANFSS